MAGPAARASRRASGHPTHPPRRSRPGTDSSQSRTLRSRAVSSRRTAARTPTGSQTGSERAGARPTRFGSTANGRRCASTPRRARHRADRRRPDLRRAGQRRPADPSGALPEGLPWPALRRTGSARWGSTGAIRSSTGTRSPKQGYRWWIERLRRTFALYDLARIDHFRGFAAFWAIPEGADELDARTGRWLPGPGESVFRAAEAELGELPVIAEDLGVITKDVEVLRDALGFPGMVVLLWAFQGPARQSAPAREPPRAPGRLHHDPRHGHAARPPAGQEPWTADRARALLTGRRLHDPRPGRARPRQRGPHEHARRAGTATGRGGSSRAS